MSKTNQRFVFAAILGLFLWFQVRNTASAKPTRVEDCIAAVVNEEVITLVDVKIAERFGLYPDEMMNASSPAILEKLIDQKVVIEFSRGRTAAGSDEIEASFNDMLLRRGSENVRMDLDEFGLEEGDLRPYLADGLLFRKVLSSRFSQNVPVSLREIEDHYRNVYRPTQEKSGTEPLPMIQVLDRIETAIRTEKRDKQIAAWIKSLRAQADIRINKDCLN